ncbi:hypothetical protein [Actinoplanes flavus]|uniref:Ig-like domain-containing protein n=1 Tax=Actinoplanes flavus TaxID=2820290 RepID=A0ABS3UX82_9ACTN|nr:hypothetical protein [Actinoplanes flavus]MBO3743191.1 hypothetical protein [Actinoplanes flavus]
MRFIRIRAIITAAALGLSTVPLIPGTAASAADDVVEWATTNGEPVSITTTTAGQKAYVYFSGSVGRHLTISCEKSAGTPTYVLQAFDGSQVEGSRTCDATRPTDINLLKADGRYRLLVTDRNAQTFGATVKVQQFDNAAGTLMAGAQPITVKTADAKQNVSLALAMTDGDRVQLTCQATGATSDITVIGPRGTVVQPDLGTNAASCSSFSVGEGPLITATETGMYQFVIHPMFSGQVKTVTAAAVRVAADATGPIATDGTPLTLATTGAYQRVKTTFSLAAPTQVYVTCARKGDDSAFITLYRPTGVSEKFGSCQYAGPGTEATAFGERLNLPAGTWTMVADPDGTSTNEFTLQVHTVPAPVTAELPLDGTPVTLHTITPGQLAQFTVNAAGGERVFIGCRLGTYREPNPWTYDAPAGVGFTHPAGQFGDSGSCEKPDQSDYPKVFFGYGIPLVRAGKHTLTVRMRMAETNSVTLWAYKIPAVTEATATTDGTPATVETSVAGQGALIRFPGVEGQKYTVSCDVTGAPRSAFLMLTSPSDAFVDSPYSTDCGPTGTFTTAALKESGDFRLNLHFQGDGTGKATVTVRPAS